MLSCAALFERKAGEGAGAGLTATQLRDELLALDPLNKVMPAIATDGARSNSFGIAGLILVLSLVVS